jgi:hypothetical protein
MRKIRGHTLDEFLFMVCLSNVGQLLKISSRQTRRMDAEVISRSALVFLVATWESFIQTVAKRAFEATLEHATSPQVFPDKVLVLASRKLREDKDERSVWELADSRWKKVLEGHQEEILRRHTGPFHSPTSENIDSLFQSLLGLKGVSRHWKWRGMTAARARVRLDQLVVLRHQIAHGVHARELIRKSTVESYTHFVHRLAVSLRNALASHLKKQTGKRIWDRLAYRGQIGELS